MVWRYVIAFTLSIAVLVGWQLLFPPQFVPPPEPTPVAPVGGGELAPGVNPAARPGEGDVGERPETPGVEPVATSSRVERPHQTLEIDYSAAQLHALPGAAGEGDAAPPSRIRLVADSRGGVLSAVYLPEYGELEDSDLPYRLLFDAPDGQRVDKSKTRFLRGLLGLSIDDHEIPTGENWIVERVDAASGPELRMSNEIDGLEISKTVSAPAGHIPFEGGVQAPDRGVFHVEVGVSFTNRSDQPIEIEYALAGPSQIGSEMGDSTMGVGSDVTVVHASWNAGKVQVQPALSPADVGTRKDTAQPAWVGLRNNYFTGVLFPLADDAGPSRRVSRAFQESYPDPWREKELLAEGGDPADAYSNAWTYLRSQRVKLEPGQSITDRYGLYLGPRTRSVLNHYETLRLVDVNDYFFLIPPFLWLLEALNTVSFGSWGLAIILLTLIVRACLHPISKKSQKSMHRFSKQMQKVKPKMEAIKERLKNDRTKQQQELQRLFKERGINPGQQLGGCLLILLQMPVWIALYRTLYYSLGLRQSSFLWIDDLTRPDQLFPLIAEVPFFGDKFAYLNVLPILYVIFTIINQRLQPKPDDQQMQAQQKMMTFMMVFFGFIFYNFPAGFMLYIMTSTLVGMIESKLIKSELAREDVSRGEPSGALARGSDPAAPPNPNPSTAGGSMYGKRKSEGGSDARSEDAERQRQKRSRKRRR